jgi:hypothetical protein
MDSNEQVLYTERLSSNLTTALFAALTLICAGLAFWRLTIHPHDWLVTLLQFLSVFFLFYTFNYRTLITTLTEHQLVLKFGLFCWRVPLDNIEECKPDQISRAMYYGGAGIHLMMIAGRYRALFNFLEYSRLVVSFKHKVGPVVDLSFSTQHPDELLQQINAAAAQAA